jgi:hypothetical protein
MLREAMRNKLPIQILLFYICERITKLLFLTGETIINWHVSSIERISPI